MWNKCETDQATRVKFYLHNTMINKILFTMFIWLINFHMWAVDDSKNIQRIFNFSPSIGLHHSRNCWNSILNLAPQSVNVRGKYDQQCLLYNPKRKRPSARYSVRGGGSPIQRLGKFSLKNSLTLECQCGDAPYCWKVINGWYSSNCGTTF